MSDEFGGLPARPTIEALLANTADAMWVIDREKRLALFNRLFAHYCGEVLGCTPKPGDTLAQIIPPDRSRMRLFWDDLYTRTLSDRSVVCESDFPILGVKRQYSISTTPVRDAGRVSGGVFLIRDITGQRRRDSHEFFKFVLAHLFSESSALDRFLERMLEAFSLSVGWDFGVAWLVEGADLVPAAVFVRPTIDGADFIRQVRMSRFRKGHGLAGRVWATNEPLWFRDLAEETLTGRTRAALDLGGHGALVFPVTDSDEVIGVCEFMTMATRPVEAELLRAARAIGAELGHYIQRYRAEAERSRLERLLTRKSGEWMTTFDSLDTPLFITDLDGQVLRVNSAARALVGVDKYSDIVGKQIRELSADSHWTSVGELIESVRDSRSSQALQIYDELGGKYWDISADYSSGGEEERAIVILRDITRLVELQDSVRRGEQLSAMGELVAGVAHEVRNPLFGISATLDALEMIVLPADDDATLLFGALRKWLDRLSALMEQLLEYGKTWTLNLQQGSVTDVIQQAVDFCQPRARDAGVELEVSFQPVLPVLLDSARLVQVFNNLILNAIQHSPRDGKVTVTARVDYDSTPPRVACTVRDSGKGFDPADLTRAFQPFYTRRRGGSGLGLSIVQRIMDEHGGTVSAENVAEGGALLRVTFPSSDPTL